MYQKQRIQVRFSPTLRDADIRQEAVRMIKKQLQDLAEKEEEEKRQQALAREAELAEEQASGVGIILLYDFDWPDVG